MLRIREVESQQVKHFKTDRIQDVELLATPQQQKLSVSVLICSGCVEEEFEVALRLSPLAYRLMVERSCYQATITSISGSYPFRFEGTVKAW